MKAKNERIILQIILVGFFSILVFTLGLNEIDIGLYSCRMIVIYIICMLIHETGHYFVGKKYHYKVIMLKFFGFKIKRQGNKWNISFRISEIFSGCVMFDFLSVINDEKDYNQFLIHFRKIILGGPAATMLLCLINIIILILYNESPKILTYFVFISSMILIGNLISGRNELNDLDLVLHYDEYRDKMLTYIFLNQGKIITNYTKCIQKCLSKHILNKEFIDEQETLFICKYFWMNLNEMDEDEKTQLFIHMDRVKFENKYLYTVLLCIIIICLYEKDDVNKYYNDILIRKGELWVLRQTSQFVFFVEEMEKCVTGKMGCFKGKKYRLGMKSIGVEL